MSSKLITIIKKKDWENVPHYLQEINIVDENNHTALHWACSTETPLSIIKLIYEANPNAVFEKNKLKRTPILCLLLLNTLDDSNQTEKIILYFLENAPMSFSEKCFDALALHNFVRNSSNSAIIEKMIKSHPNAFKSVPGHRKAFLDVFYADWYFSVKSSLEHAIANETSREDFLQLEISDRRGRKNTIKNVNALPLLILQDSSSDEDDNRSLHSAIQNPSIPWLWCELMLFLHPEQIDQNPGDVSQIHPNLKQESHKKIFKCSHCFDTCHRKPTLRHNSSLFCTKHAKEMFKVNKFSQSDLLLENFDQIEEENSAFVNFFYDVLRTNPSMGKIALDNMTLINEQKEENKRKHRHLATKAFRIMSKSTMTENINKSIQNIRLLKKTFLLV